MLTDPRNSVAPKKLFQALDWGTNPVIIGEVGSLTRHHYSHEQNVAAQKSPWGTVLGTGSASIDIVLIEATRPLSGQEILDEVSHRGLPMRKDANPHLTTLKKKGYVENEGGRWFKTSLGATQAGV